VDSAWEQKKLEAGQTLENGDDWARGSPLRPHCPKSVVDGQRRSTGGSHVSSAHFVGYSFFRFTKISQTTFSFSVARQCPSDPSLCKAKYQKPYSCRNLHVYQKQQLCTCNVHLKYPTFSMPCDI